VTTMVNTECEVFYEGYGDITDSMICASGEGKDACQGDSGGEQCFIFKCIQEFPLFSRSLSHSGIQQFLLLDWCGVLGGWLR
jgi:hypothetical protein